MSVKGVSRLDVDGIPLDLSITGKGELLVGVTKSSLSFSHCYLKVFDLTNSTWKLIPLPSEIGLVISVVQTPNQNFIISYVMRLKAYIPKQFRVSILSPDGQTIIKTVDTRFNILIMDDSLPPALSINHIRLAVKDDGQIFATDFFGGSRVLLLNSDLTGCRVLSNNGQRFETWSSIVYVQEKQQLFIPGLKGISPFHLGDKVISVFHLSPCYHNIIAAQQPAN